MPSIIIKKYDHFNKAFPKWDTPQGVHVKNKDHYDRLMKENNMVTYEESVDRSKNYKMKPMELSSEGKAIIQAAAMSKDKKGNVKLGDKTVDAMIKIGAINKNIPSYMKLPSVYEKVKIGGF